MCVCVLTLDGGGLRERTEQVFDLPWVQQSECTGVGSLKQQCVCQRVFHHGGSQTRL